jgi:hypothetical protein
LPKIACVGDRESGTERKKRMRVIESDGSKQGFLLKGKD